MFIAAQFTIGKIRIQPRGTQTDDWIKKLWYNIHNGLLFSHVKKWSLDNCKKVNATIGYYAKWNKPDWARHHIFFSCLWKLI